MSELTDTHDLPQEWAKRFRDGDREAFRQLHAQYAAGLLAFLRARCGGALDPDELGQDVWLRVWHARQQFQDGNFRAWLFQIARHRLTDEYRRHGGRRASQLAEEFDVAAATEHDDGSLHALRDCLQAVGGDFVAVLRQRLEGVPDQSIAEQMQISVSTVYTRADRGKKALRDCIESKLR